MRPWMEKWGSVLLIFFCALVIVFSALYTRQDDLRRMAAQTADANQNETLADVQAARYVPPVKGSALSEYKGIYKDQALWRLDPYIRYAVQKGDTVYACCEGEITLASPTELFLSDGTLTFCLRGDFSLTASGVVRASQPIAVMKSRGELLLSLTCAGSYLNPLDYFTP